MRHLRVKKLGGVLVIALVAAAIVWVILRHELTRRVASAPDLLPATTLAVVHVPDLPKTMRRWQTSDLSRIWSEPGVQTWLEQSFGHFSKDRPANKALEEFAQLEPTHAFLALTSLENNDPKLIAGFHFERSPEEVRRFIEQREADFLAQSARARRATIKYERHKIETFQIARFTLARVYDNQWFFVANDLNTLKALLDRVDHRREEGQGTLGASDAFTAAKEHLPNEYSMMLYLDPRPFAERLTPFLALTGQTLVVDQLLRLRQMRSVATTIGFDRGKMRETDFVATPSLEDEKKLQRPLLGTAGTNTVLYSVSRVHWSDNLMAPTAPVALGLPSLLRQFAAVMNARGIAPADWRQAFGDELEIVGDWPAGSRWPAVVTALPVKDNVRARKIVEAIASVEIAGTPWTQASQNNVLLYRSHPFGDFIPLSPTLALSDKMFVTGSDAEAVDSTLERLAHPAHELAKSALFHGAEIKVPRGDRAFSYVNTRLFYKRVDAAARPLLLLGSSFYPALAKNINASKWPPAEAIASHLSPIVMSQRYERNGYVTESVGPITFREATVGMLGVAGGAYLSLQKALKDHIALPHPVLPSGPIPTPLPAAVSATPSPP